MKRADNKAAIGVSDWENYRPFFPLPVRLRNGKWTLGLLGLMRRKTATGWEYDEKPESDDDWASRQF